MERPRVTPPMPSAAVTPLRTLGDPGLPNAPWPDYPAEYGLTRDDVPALVGLALDETPYVQDDPAVWGAVHAWRALAQLGAPEAAEPLARLLARQAGPDEDDDWAISELPRALAMLGPPAFAPVRRLFDDAALGFLVRGCAADALGALAARAPEVRAECVDALVAVLGREDTDSDVAASAVAGLIEARAVEAAPAIEAAFAADRVEPSFNGDWEDVQIALGLLEERRTPRPRYVHPGLEAVRAYDEARSAYNDLPPNPDVGTAARRAQARAKTKAKRKAAVKARRANRRKR